MIEHQLTFRNNITNTWGKKGSDWLSILPEVIAFLSERWSLSDIKPVNNMTYNYVALAMQNNTVPVALKISFDVELIQNEYKVLKYFNNRGVVSVLDFDQKYNALLLEQAIPGDVLKKSSSAGK